MFKNTKKGTSLSPVHVEQELEPSLSNCTGSINLLIFKVILQSRDLNIPK